MIPSPFQPPSPARAARVGLLLALLAGAAAAAPVPQPEVRVEGFRFVVERLHQVQNLTLQFPNGAPAKGGGSQQLYVELAVYPPAPGMIPQIQGLSPRIMASSQENRPVAFQSFTAEDADPAAWRARLLAGDVELGVSRLTGLQGELLVYPRAKVVTLEFPLPSPEPATRQEEGLRGLLKSTMLADGRLSVSLEADWSSDVRIAPVEADVPDGIQALSKAGAPISPQSASVSTYRRDGREGRQHTLTYAPSRELPTRLRVQAVVRSGSPRKVAFTLPDMALPDTLDLSAELKEPEEEAVLFPGHPLFQKDGGTLRLPVTLPAGTSGGILVVGLSRKEAAGFGPWRWLEVPVGAGGAAVLPTLRPGHYRVTRSWSAEGGGTARPPRPGEALEVDVLPGKAAALPPVTGGRR